MAFLSPWNGVSLLFQEKTGNPNCHLWTDASGTWGCGAFWEGRWFQVGWQQFPAFAASSIAVKELLPIVLAGALWGSQWGGLTVQFNCDNEAVVTIIASGAAKDDCLAHLLCALFFVEAKFQFVAIAEHIPGVQNTVADALSRNNLDIMHSLSPQVLQRPTPVPHALVEALTAHNNWQAQNWTTWFNTIFIQQ